VHTFAFILHPLDKQDIAKKYKFARYLPLFAVEQMIRKLPPKLVSEITGVRSLTGAEVKGWFVGLPLMPRQLLRMDEQFVLSRIIEAARIAEDLGAGVVGLGAYTSVVGDAGITVDKNVTIAVTTGNSYTVYTAIEGVKEAARLLEIDVARARAAVVGATGSIGRVCSQLIAQDVAEVVLVGRDQGRLEEARASFGPGNYTIMTDVHRALKDADLVVAVSSAVDAVIQPRNLKPGAVVCDVARPRDVSVAVARRRPDVLVIEGGVVAVPGDVDFGFDFGFPPKTAYACMAETMIIALEGDGNYVSYTLGRDLALDQVRRIGELAAKHGFRLAGFRSFEREVTEQQIESVRRAARRT